MDGWLLEQWDGTIPSAEVFDYGTIAKAVPASANA